MIRDGACRRTRAAVTLKYKVRGDRLDGTYLAIDSSHAHINMPAAIMWGRGLDDRPATLTFDPPDGAPWQVATQLFGYTGTGLRTIRGDPSPIRPLTSSPRRTCST